MINDNLYCYSKEMNLIKYIRMIYLKLVNYAYVFICVYLYYACVYKEHVCV